MAVARTVTYGQVGTQQGATIWIQNARIKQYDKVGSIENAALAHAQQSVWLPSNWVVLQLPFTHSASVNPTVVLAKDRPYSWKAVTMPEQKHRTKQEQNKQHAKQPEKSTRNAKPAL